MSKKNTTALAAEPLVLIEIDPATLGVDDQVRADATPDDELVSSIARFGVLQPPTVYWDADREQHIVVIGHRRVGAAIAAKLASIQVLVRNADEAKDARRTEQQLVENERRAALTPADVARGYKDLSLFGLRPEDIAAAVAEKPERVVAALKATTSVKATTALERGIDLEQAALIAEFDDDPAAQDSLTTIALNNPGNFGYKVEEARAKQAASARIAELIEQLRIDGCSLLDTVRWNDTYWSGGVDDVPRGQARTLSRMGISRADHTACPGHAAIIHNASSEKYVEILYVCTDYKGNGHDAEPELTPEALERQQEFERHQAEARAAEAAFTANAKARRDWLRGFIGGRLNQTAGLFEFIAAATIGAAALDQLDRHADDHIAIYILTGEEISKKWDTTPLAEMLTAGRVAPLRAMTADALATAEAVTWRDVDARYCPRLAVAYFDALTAWGYPFTDIDTLINAAAMEALAEAAADEREDEDETDEEDAA